MLDVPPPLMRLNKLSKDSAEKRTESGKREGKQVGQIES